MFYLIIEKFRQMPKNQKIENLTKHQYHLIKNQAFLEEYILLFPHF